MFRPPEEIVTARLRLRVPKVADEFFVWFIETLSTSTLVGSIAARDIEGGC
jgi:hypothetical protein